MRITSVTCLSGIIACFLKWQLNNANPKFRMVNTMKTRLNARQIIASLTLSTATFGVILIAGLVGLVC